jgi:hypothetical protein
MRQQLLSKLNTLYEEDYDLWLETTAQQIREQDFAAIDWENLLEEIESLGREQKNKVESYLKQTLKHLLLYQYWEAEKLYCAEGWADEIDNFRGELEILTRSQTLGNYLVSILEDTYQKARRSACRKSKLANLPEQCPYTVEQILDPDWLPDAS